MEKESTPSPGKVLLAPTEHWAALVSGFPRTSSRPRRLGGGASPPAGFTGVTVELVAFWFDDCRPEELKERQIDCLVLSCVVLSCLVLSCLVLCCFVLSCLVLSVCLFVGWFVCLVCLVCLVASFSLSFFISFFLSFFLCLFVCLFVCLFFCLSCLWFQLLPRLQLGVDQEVLCMKYHSGKLHTHKRRHVPLNG